MKTPTKAELRAEIDRLRNVVGKSQEEALEHFSNLLKQRDLAINLAQENERLKAQVKGHEVLSSRDLSIAGGETRLLKRVQERATGNERTFHEQLVTDYILAVKDFTGQDDERFAWEHITTLKARLKKMERKALKWKRRAKALGWKPEEQSTSTLK